MNLEHAGGAPESALESDSIRSSHVSIVQPNYDAFDSIIAHITECIMAGDKQRLVDLLHDQADERATEALVCVLGFIIDSKHPRRTAHQLIWGSGMMLKPGLSLPTLAARYGISKQAFQQGAKQLFIRLDLEMRPNRRCLGVVRRAKAKAGKRK